MNPPKVMIRFTTSSKIAFFSAELFTFCLVPLIKVAAPIGDERFFHTATISFL